MRASDANSSIENIFTITLEDVLEDADQDGFSDQQEDAANSDPLDAKSRPDSSYRLVGHWPLDGNLSDVSGNENHVSQHP